MKHFPLLANNKKSAFVRVIRVPYVIRQPYQ